MSQMISAVFFGSQLAFLSATVKRSVRVRERRLSWRAFSAAEACHAMRKHPSAAPGTHPMPDCFIVLHQLTHQTVGYNTVCRRRFRLGQVQGGFATLFGCSVARPRAHVLGGQRTLHGTPFAITGLTTRLNRGIPWKIQCNSPAKSWPPCAPCARPHSRTVSYCYTCDRLAM